MSLCSLSAFSPQLCNGFLALSHRRRRNKQEKDVLTTSKKQREESRNKKIRSYSIFIVNLNTEELRMKVITRALIRMVAVLSLLLAAASRLSAADNVSPSSASAPTSNGTYVSSFNYGGICFRIFISFCQK